jgi:hypothetical protein
MEQEIWKPVIGYEGCYSVSNIGRIRSDRNKKNSHIGKILKQKIGWSYYSVTLSKDAIKKTRFVAHMVIEAFVGRNTKDLEVNHKDGNKLNNHIDNLEYVTHSENLYHAHRNNFYKFPTNHLGSENGRAKIHENDVVLMRKLFSDKTMSTMQLAVKYGISRAQTNLILNRKSWKHI